MDCLKAVQSYVTRVVSETPGIKILLLDQDTTGIVSLASTQSSLLSHEVYLTDRIDNPSRSLPSHAVASGSRTGGPSSYPPSRGVERLPHLKCICFLRPTEEGIQACERELREGRYGGYWLYFTNVLKKSQIERLAEADEHELVREVQEYFADYSPLASSHFTLSLLPTPLHPSSTARTVPLYGPSPSVWSNHGSALELHKQQLSALLLSLKKRPLIRYERMSGMAKRLGEELVQGIRDQPELWDFRRGQTAPLLMILDRRNDPVTPLLTQWTYQAMVHELLGITNGRVSLGDAPEVREDLKEIVLSPDQDSFFAANLYDNFGDLGAHLSAYVSDYSTRSASSQASKIETVSDMKRFIEDYPEFRKLGGNVSKHVALVGELSRLVNARKLLELSELEQSLASNESHAADLKILQTMISSAAVLPEAKLRLAILYALRYQKSPQANIPGVIDLLKQQGVPDADMVLAMLNFAGADQRQDDLFANENFFSRGKSALKGLKGVENVYTQHTPHLAETIENLLKGRLRETSYPYVEGQGVGQGGVARPQDVIVFIVGGTTYEEAKYVAGLNAQFAAGHGLGNGPNGPVGAGTRILLGGTCVHNSKSFLEMTKDATFGFSGTATGAAVTASSLAAGQVPAGPVSVNLGPVNVNLERPEGLAGEALDAARDGLKSLFGKVREGLQEGGGLRL